MGCGLWVVGRCARVCTEKHKRWKHGDSGVGKYKTIRNICRIIKTRTPCLARSGQLWTKKRPKTALFPGRIVFVRGSYSARVPRSSLPELHREFVHHIVEDEVRGQDERQDGRREDRQQGEESGEVEENQTRNMSACR